jgi:hypothetical protein
LNDRALGAMKKALFDSHNGLIRRLELSEVEDTQSREHVAFIAEWVSITAQGNAGMVNTSGDAPSRSAYFAADFSHPILSSALAAMDQAAMPMFFEKPRQEDGLTVALLCGKCRASHASMRGSVLHRQFEKEFVPRHGTSAFHRTARIPDDRL